MGISEVVMSAMMGRMVVLGMALGMLTVPGYCPEFADGLHLVICNTLFTKQEAKLVTCGWPGTITVVMVRQEDKGKVRNVKVISSEECVPKHKLLVMVKKGTGRPYSITEHRVPELIPVLGSQPAGDVTHKPGGKRPLLSAKPAVIPATLNRAATNFAAW